MGRNFGFIEKEMYTVRVREYLAGFSSGYFDQYSDSQDRIVKCIRDVVRQAQGESIMVVSHGLIITLFLSYLLGNRLEYGDWLKLRTPDLSIVNLTSANIEKGFYSGSKLVEDLKCD